MSKKDKYLQYVKSRKKPQLNIKLQQMAIEFGRLLGKRYCFIFSGGIHVEFSFHMANFYHLLGFHKLTDVTVVKMVEERRLSKENFYKLMRDGKITFENTDSAVVSDTETETVHICDTARKSELGEIKANRFQFFTEQNVMELLQSDLVIDFDKNDCLTLIEADKVFFKLITDKVRNLNLFIGYDAVEKEYYAATFFLEKERDKFLLKTSGERQEQLRVLSRTIIDSTNNKIIDFYVKWENVRREFMKEPFYNAQKRLKTWINSKHISSKEVREQITVQKELLLLGEEQIALLSQKYDIVRAVNQLNNSEEKEKAQLSLMEYDIDADDLACISEYQGIDVNHIKAELSGKQSKQNALKNKLDKHEKYQPDIEELEIQEVIKVYQEYLPEMEVDREKVKELIERVDIFDEIILPNEFEKMIKEEYTNYL